MRRGEGDAWTTSAGGVAGRRGDPAPALSPRGRRRAAAALAGPLAAAPGPVGHRGGGACGRRPARCAALAGLVPPGRAGGRGAASPGRPARARPLPDGRAAGPAARRDRPGHAPHGGRGGPLGRAAVRGGLHRVGHALRIAAAEGPQEGAAPAGGPGGPGRAGGLEKGGLTTALTAAGVTQRTALAFGDELRVGLCGQVRRVWAPRGVKVRQRVQWRREWRYLALAVDGRRGSLHWCWIASMQGTAIAEAVAAWQAQGVEAGAWDGARGRRAPGRWRAKSMPASRRRWRRWSASCRRWPPTPSA